MEDWRFVKSVASWNNVFIIICIIIIIIHQLFAITVY